MGEDKFAYHERQHKTEKWSKASEKPTDLRKWNAVQEKK